MGKTFTASVFILAFCTLIFGQNSDCPTVKVNEPPIATLPGESVTFSVSVGNETENPKYQYIWSVSSGKIVEGQGTATITVSEIPFDSVPTATVEIKGLPEGCANTDSETAMVGCRLLPILFDEFEISSKPASLKNLDALISELQNRPIDSVYFIIYSHEKDSSNKLKSREKHIRDYLRANSIESERLTFVTIDGDDPKNSVIKIWFVPQGAEPPTP